MKKQKIINILEAILIIVLGVLTAVSGGGAALDLYIAIVSLVAGVAVAVLTIVKLNETRVLDFLGTFLACTLIVIASVMFAGRLSFGIIIVLLVYALIGLGGALIFHGIYLLTKKANVPATVEIVSGVIFMTLAILYLTIQEFATAFWIVVGVFIALYGIYALIFAIINKE